MSSCSAALCIFGDWEEPPSFRIHTSALPLCFSLPHTYTHIFLASPWIFFLILKTFGCSLRGLETFREKKSEITPQTALLLQLSPVTKANKAVPIQFHTGGYTVLGESPLLFHMCAFSLFILAYYILAKGCYGFSFFLFCFVGYCSFNIEIYYVFVFTVLKMYVFGCFGHVCSHHNYPILSETNNGGASKQGLCTPHVFILAQMQNFIEIVLSFPPFFC